MMREAEGPPDDEGASSGVVFLMESEWVLGRKIAGSRGFLI